MRGSLFGRVLLATGLSDTATGAFSVAAAVLVATSTGSTAAVAAVTIAATVPWLLFALPAGAAADRLDRPRLIGTANALRGVVMLAAGVAVAVGLPVTGVLAAAVFVVAALQTLVDTAAEAMVPDLVEAHRLGDAHGMLAVATRLCQQFAGPLLAGVLLTVSSSAPSLVAGVTCCLAALLVGTLGRSCAPVRRPAAGPAPTARQGLALVARRPDLAALVAVGGGTTAANAAFLTVLAVYALAPGGLGLSTSQYGLLLGCVGIGAAIGSLLTGRVQARTGQGLLLALTRVGWAVVFAAPALVSGLLLALTVTVGSAFGGMWTVAATSLRQRAVDARQRGSVAGVQRLVQYGCAPLGAALGGLGGSRLDPRAVFLGCAALTLFMIVPVLRHLGTPR